MKNARRRFLCGRAVDRSLRGTGACVASKLADRTWGLSASSNVVLETTQFFMTIDESPGHEHRAGLGLAACHRFLLLSCCADESAVSNRP